VKCFRLENECKLVVDPVATVDRQGVQDGLTIDIPLPQSIWKSSVNNQSRAVMAIMSHL